MTNKLPTMKPAHKLTLAVLLLLFAAAKVALLLWWQQSQPTAAELDCRPEQAACPFDGTARLQLLGVGGHRTPFTVRIDGLPENVRQVSASFEMRDMDMGFNRFDLKKQNNGTWQAEAVRLPVCTAARHDWRVRWRVDGREYTAPFQTHP